MKRPGSLFSVLLVLCGICAAAPKNGMPRSSAPSRVRVSFVENSGQASAQYKYLVTSQQVSAKFRDNGVDFEVLNSSGQSIRFPVDFGKAASVEANEVLPGKVNYLLGSNDRRWRRNLTTYGRLHYQSVFPGVDLEFYGNPGELEHDFIVKPGADAAAIKIQVPITHSIEIMADGAALIHTNGAFLKFSRPVAYQETDKGRIQVAASFNLKRHTLGVRVGKYRHDLPLVIDPAVVFSTYVADASAPMTAVATDANGNTYVLGYTFAANYPVRGAFQPTCNNCSNRPDVVITKLNASGSDIVFSTYLGGSEAEVPIGIGIDANGNVIVAGRTDSPDFPVKNGLPSGTPSYVQPVSFITSLSPDGSSLNYSTLLGHASTVLTAFALAADGSVYVSGTTNDSDFPVTPGAINTLTPAYPNEPVFVTKFKLDGTLAYSGIVGNAEPQNGGGGLIGVTGIAVDAQGAVYLHGNAGQLWPTTTGAYQTSIPGTNPYAAPFITKLSADGSKLDYSTFLGPASGIAPAAITVNAAGEAWVTGAWAGPDFPLTPDAYANQLSSSAAPYLSRVSADGSTLLYSSYLTGSISNAYPTAIKFDGNGHLWIAGYTADHSLTLLNPVQSSFAYSGQAGFLMEFDNAAKTLLFSSYFGAQSSSQIAGIAIDGTNKIHIAGWSLQDLNTTPGTYRTSVTPPPQYIQYLYPFAAVLDPGSSVGTICVTVPTDGYVYFPPTLLGTSTTASVTIENCGTADLTSLSFTLGDPQLSLPSSSNGCTGTLSPQATCSLTVVYTPASETGMQTTLTIRGIGNVLPVALQVFGVGATPHATGYPGTLSFDPLLVGTSSHSFVAVQNSGQVPLHVDVANISISGDYQFSITNCAASIFPQQWCLIEVTFAPTAAGTRNGTLQVPTDDPAHPVVSFALNGTAVATYPIPVINLLDYGSAPVGATDVTAMVSGSGFFAGSTVLLNGNPQETTYDSYTTLSFKVSPSALTDMAELHVTVSNPAPGGGTSNSALFTVYKLIPGSYRALAFSQATGMLYATVPEVAFADENSILVINPTTGQTESKIATGLDPNTLALSGDGQYLFVALDGDHTIIRINCSTKAIEKTYSLPVDSTTGQRDTAFQIVPVPGTPKSFVAALRAPRSPSSDGVALFDDTGMISRIPFEYPNWLEVYSIAFASDPHTLYAQPFENYGTLFFKTITIDSNGLHYTRPTGNFVEGGSGNSVVSDGTLLYTDFGGVFDPVTKSKVATLPTSQSIVLPDPQVHRLFTFNQFDQSPSQYQALSLVSLDSNYTTIGKVYFDTTRTGIEAGSLVRWGRDGMGVLTGQDFTNNFLSNLVLLRSSIVAPPEIPDFQWQADGSGASATVNPGESATYQLSLASSGGFSGQVSLACSGAPLYATCTVTPSSVALDGTASPAVSVVITTSQTTNSAALRWSGRSLVVACLFVGMLFFAPRRRRESLRTPLCMLVVIATLVGTVALSSCGGGGSTPPPNPVTHYVASGTYTLQVKATSGTTVRSQSLTLVVR